MYEDAPQAVDAPLDAQVGRERGPAQEVGTEGERPGPSNLPRGEAFRCLHRLGSYGLFPLYGLRLRFFHKRFFLLVYNCFIRFALFIHIGSNLSFPFGRS